MNNDWIEFNEDGFMAKRGRPQVRLTQGWLFRINKEALERMGKPQAVRFLYDAGRQRIGIRPAPPEANFAFPLKSENRGFGRYVCGSMFCKRFGISRPESVLEFQSVRIDDDGTLVLDLKSAKSSTG